MSSNTSCLEDDYTNHLRTSSYALLAAGPDPGLGPLSLLQQERQERQERYPGSRAALRAAGGSSASVFQSLPYMVGSQVGLMMTIFT